MPERGTHHKSTAGQRGNIIAFFDGIAHITGLSGVSMHEVLLDREGREVAIVIGFSADSIEAIFFDANSDMRMEVYRSGYPMAIAISETIIGRVVDGVGKARDELGPVQGDLSAVFRTPPTMLNRKPVTTPLITGIKMIDAVLPLGRGQRELIIGDRKLGKTAIALDTVLNQKYADKPVYCVYVLCGQKEQVLQDLLATLKKHNALTYTVVVAATADDSYAAQYLAPFVGCAIGEFFRDREHDALIVYDDLSKHAKTYRSMALLLGRAPGRESYPGDIFSLHAGLLERSAQLSDDVGGGSLTALPIVETQEGDITAFVPTNLISITDGQIYLERSLFQKGFMPAINVGLSISRIGSAAQPPLLQSVVGGIRLTLSQHKELQKLTQLETQLSAQARTKIHRGDLTLELLRQRKHHGLTWQEQAVLFYAVEHGFFDDLTKEQWRSFEHMLLELMRTRYRRVVRSCHLDATHDQMAQKVRKIVSDAKEEFLLV